MSCHRGSVRLLSSGSTSGLITEADSFDDLYSAVSSGGDGTVGVLDQGYGTIIELYNNSGTIGVVNNRINLGFVDDESPCFSVGDAVTGTANILTVKTGASDPTWGDVSAGNGGLICSEGTLWLAFVDFLDLNAQGVMCAAADFEPTVTTAVDNQILAGVGFLKANQTQALFGGIARDVTDWEATRAFGDPTGALTTSNQFSGYQRPNAESHTITAHWLSQQARLANDRGHYSAGGHAGDESTATNVEFAAGDAGMSNSDTQWVLAIIADKLTGDLSSRCTAVSWLSHPRPGGATP